MPGQRPQGPPRGSQAYKDAAQQDASLWLLAASCIPLVALLGFAVLSMALSKLRNGNIGRRQTVLETLWQERVGNGGDRIASAEGPRKRRNATKGKATAAGSIQDDKIMVGFWHPYCNAGGGGERVLWTAISYLQRTHGNEVVSLVYTGDYPAASKKEILSKVKTRFGMSLQEHTIHFVPLPSRRLIDDTYWKRFTLLGQSLGSIWLLLQGIGVIGRDGVWGDYFIDTMGYAFTFPIFHFITGGKIPIGAYVHYPTISSDMVARVKERKAGVTNQSAVASSRWRTRGKIIYYSIFTRLYSLALLFSDHIMTNSSWTQAHIASLLYLGRTSFLSGFMEFGPGDAGIRALALQSSHKAGGNPNGDVTAHMSAEPRPQQWIGSEVVYPPCDTAELAQCGKLEKRERIIVSLAQFRPEKEHATQLRALSHLFTAHPEYRGAVDPKKTIRLVMMGSSRNVADDERVKELQRLAKELDVVDNVEFVVNAPYPEVISWLGKSSVGINTMVDEHFGINVVEFMAAGLIPLVHASAGPLLDIVVPLNGQRTGYHATDAKSFSVAMHEILSLPIAEQTRIRQAARKLAQTKFSQEQFEKGWQRGWKKMLERKAAIEAADQGKDQGANARRG